MEKKPKVDHTKIHLLDMRIDAQEIFNNEKDPVSQDEIDNYEYGIALTKLLEEKKNIAIVKFDFEIKAIPKKKKKRKAGGRFAINLIFKIDNIFNYIKKNKKGWDMNDTVDNALVDIAYNTSRGILIERYKNTILENSSLPIVSAEFLNTAT